MNFVSKMYQVSSEKFPIAQPTTSCGKTEEKKSRKLPLKKQQHPYDNWVRFRERIRETNVRREALIK